jgi:hypothetical protein
MLTIQGLSDDEGVKSGVVSFDLYSKQSDVTPPPFFNRQVWIWLSRQFVCSRLPENRADAIVTAADISILMFELFDSASFSNEIKFINSI